MSSTSQVRPVALEETPQRRTFWSDFAQQRLRAWQPVLSPKWVLSLYFGCGVVFIVVGALLLNASHSVVEYSQDYTDHQVDANSVGHLEIDIERDMKPPIWVYYQLSGFHQNHRRYVKSRSNTQMSKTKADNPEISPGSLDDCKPWVTTDERVNYPCGLVARSVFNDTYLLEVQEPGLSTYTSVDVDDSAQTIAWAGDLDGHFKNADPEQRHPNGETNQELLNMWVLRYFPPVTCKRLNPSISYVPIRVNMRSRENSANNDIVDCTHYTSEHPTCNFTHPNGQAVDCVGPDYRVERVPDWGIQSGHFIVWMRIAGLPSFRKLWGKVEKPLKAGSKLKVTFEHNFPVKEFGGTKSFVISTSTMLGGKNDFLGFGYLTVGGCCVVFGIVFLWRHMMHPRLQGDLNLLTDAQ